MEKQFDILNKNRMFILNLIEPLSFEQLATIPKGFNNHIAWNVAHLVVTQQLLCYKLSGLDGLVDNALIESYRKGTNPSHDTQLTPEKFEEIKHLFKTLPTQLETDYKAKVFSSYQEYTTSNSITLQSIEDAIQFNNLHEGLHLGSILALKRMVTLKVQ